MRRIIAQRRLQMALVDVEHLFGGERIVFYFLSEKRVDFRELVKDLAREFMTRIEMRQIGVRDEAKLLADYGDCGKPVCCNTHMPTMPPVPCAWPSCKNPRSIRPKSPGVAAGSSAASVSSKTSTKNSKKQLPAPGTRVLTAKGQGHVLAQEILARKVLVQFEDGRRVIVAASEILTNLK